MEERDIILKLNTTDSTLTKITNVNPIKGSQANDVYYLYAPFGTNAALIKFEAQRYYDGDNPFPAIKTTRITDDEVIQAKVGEYYETAWSLYYLKVGVGISGVLQSSQSSTYKVAFTELNIDTSDTLYLGEYATAEDDVATISDELDVKYPDAEADEYVNVYNTTTNTYYSFLYNGSTWISQDELINSQIIGNTQSYLETFKGTVFSNDDFNMGTPTAQALVLNQIYTEIEELNSTISANELLLEYVNQDVKDTASPSFVKVTTDEVDADLVTTDKVDFGTREITDNTTDETLNVKLNANVTMQLGQEEFIHAVNKTGVTITNGQVVYLMGASGNTPQIALADNTVKAKAHNTIGVATEAFGNNELGFVTVRGLVRGLDTSAFAEGDILYLSTAGTLTNVKPTPPLYNVEVGICVTSNAGTGTIYVGVEKVHEIADAPDVYNDSPSEGDILKYNVAG